MSRQPLAEELPNPAHRLPKRPFCRVLPLAMALLAATLHALPSRGTEPAVAAVGVGETIVFTDVDVVPMDRPGILRRQSVVVRGGRIETVAPADQVEVPAGVRVIDGRGRYLAPGLADLHVHLNPSIGARENFGDAPLFLAHGVTTVLNLSGEPQHVIWRERVRTGELTAPRLFTSGEFLDEPRIADPAAAERAVREQAAAGVDVIKVHEVVVPGRGYVTTRGIGDATFRRLSRTARSLGLPVVGHVPRRVALATVLAEGMTVAHGEILFKIHLAPLDRPVFAPLWRLGRWLVLLLVLALGASFRRRRRAGRAAGVTALGTALLTATLVPGQLLGFRVGSMPVLVVAALAVVASLGLALRLLIREDGRQAKALGALAALVALVCLPWLAVAWRSTDQGLAHLARSLARAGIFVTPNLTVPDTASRLDGATAERWADGPAGQVLRPDLRAAWRGTGDDGWRARLDRVDETRMLATLERLTAALADAGVPLLLGTDTYGYPWVVPGLSVHRELELLRRAGLSPHQALATATADAGRFLSAVGGGPGERAAPDGTVAAGARADLLLLSDDPLRDLATLRRPLGVLVAGRWFDRAALDVAVAGLRQTSGTGEKKEAPPVAR